MAKRRNNSLFPFARVKKIMQEDEDVGKISSVVPIVMSKALELFISDLVNHAVNTVKSVEESTITNPIMKLCIEENPEFDFLRQVTDHIPDYDPEKSEQKRRGRPKKSLVNLHENQSDKPESQKKKQRKSYKKLERAIPHELSAVPPNIIIPEMQSAEKILGISPSNSYPLHFPLARTITEDLEMINELDENYDEY